MRLLGIFGQASLLGGAGGCAQQVDVASDLVPYLLGCRMCDMAALRLRPGFVL